MDKGLPARSCHSRAARATLECAACAEPGVFASACWPRPALIAVVSLITFGVLLDGLQDQSRTAIKARAANDAVTQAGGWSGSRSTLESGVRGYALTGDRAQLEPYERARAEVAAAGAKLLALEIEPAERARAKALIAGLEQYADSLARHRRRPEPDPAATALETGRGLQAFRAQLATFAADRARRADATATRGHAAAHPRDPDRRRRPGASCWR